MYPRICGRFRHTQSVSRRSPVLHAQVNLPLRIRAAHTKSNDLMIRIESLLKEDPRMNGREILLLTQTYLESSSEAPKFGTPIIFALCQESALVGVSEVS